ncbi:hypothetical protein L1D19_05695 [Vibrio natriegens]|uniref:hypothetical protein n=1 Tax=Vibrio natriegens TaxID=691 RepID=UPI001EFDCA82|nr:hypothetical protein [Vibrio natriegens]MCG9699624.1 hypothetical protein [Vibrio natriegens]
MKKMVVTLALLFSSYVSANWDVNQNGVAVQSASNDFDSLAILEFVDGTYYVSFIDTSYHEVNSECEEHDSTIREINGQPVKLHTVCDRGVSRHYALTDKGREFVINELKTKNSVKFGDDTYSAIGFSAALEKLKQRHEWEKEAL